MLTDGRTSWDEALLGIIPGAVVLAISFVIFVTGLIIVLVQRKKKATVTAESGGFSTMKIIDVRLSV